MTTKKYCRIIDTKIGGLSVQLLLTIYNSSFFTPETYKMIITMIGYGDEYSETIKGTILLIKPLFDNISDETASDIATRIYNKSKVSLNLKYLNKSD